MPRISDVLFGVRNLLLVALCLLLVSAVIAALFGLVNLSYPANEVTNLVLWAAVLMGSFTTIRNLPRLENGWLFGGVTGAAFGLIVAVVMAVYYSIAGSFSNASVLGLLLLIVVYAVLGLVGAFAGRLSDGGRRDY